MTTFIPLIQRLTVSDSMETSLLIKLLLLALLVHDPHPGDLGDRHAARVIRGVRRIAVHSLCLRHAVHTVYAATA